MNEHWLVDLVSLSELQYIQGIATRKPSGASSAPYSRDLLPAPFLYRAIGLGRAQGRAGAADDLTVVVVNVL